MASYEDINVKVDCGIAHELADLELIRNDLERAVKCCERLISLRGSPKSEPLIRESLWITALVAYARCFGKGKRLRLDDAFLRRLAPSTLATHKFMLGLRNGHIAHSVNVFEQAQVGVTLSHPASTIRRVTAVPSTLVSYFVTHNGAQVLQLRRLAFSIQRRVDAKIRSLSRRFRELVKSIPVAELYRLPLMGTADVNHNDVTTLR